MMNKYSNSEILEIIHNDETYYEAVENITKSDELTDDLYSELLIIFGEYDNDTLNELLEKGDLKFYWVRICMNQWNSSSSPFYSKYRKENIEYTDANTEVKDLEVKEERDLERVAGEYDKNDIMYNKPYSEVVREATEKALDDMYWYKSRLFRLYVELGSYRAVEEETLIPQRSVGETIREVKKDIKKQINIELKKLGR